MAWLGGKEKGGIHQLAAGNKVVVPCGCMHAWNWILWRARRVVPMLTDFTVVIGVWPCPVGRHEHGLKTAAQSTVQHEIIWAGLAQPEKRAGSCFDFQPVVPPARPACLGRAWAGPTRDGPMNPLAGTR